MVNVVVERKIDETEVKCIFCGKVLDRSEMVRYRGAISCRECAAEQESKPKPILRPFFYIAAIGSLVGMLTFIYFTFHVLRFAIIYPTSYIQPLVPFFGGMTVSTALISLGLFAINRVHLFAASIVSVVIGAIATISSALAVYDFITAGPYYIIETVTYTKTISYYPTAIATYSLFAIVAALAILLHMANIRTEYLSIASAGLLLLSSAIVISIYTSIVAGMLNTLVFAVLFVFFMTRRRVYEEDPIQPL